MGMTAALLLFGLLMVASASMVISDRQFGYPFHYLFRQAIYLGFGILLAFAATRVPLTFWQSISTPLLFIGLFLLILVLIPGIGRVMNGSRRWLNLGFITLQVSELIKLAALLYLAGYLQRHAPEVQSQLSGFLKPLIFLAVMALLLLLEPDFGATFVLSAMFLILLFVGGVRFSWFLLLLGVAIAALAALALLSPYRLQRLTTFLNPWNAQYGSGYQLTQSLIAFGQGGFWGVGLGNSIQKLFYLPEAHTDFLFAVIAEELGLVGVLAFMVLFVALIVTILRLARFATKENNLFASYVAYGAAAWLGIQGMINIGVNAGVLPTKGLTLPFVSYGGSSMLVNCLLIGIILRISHETNWRGKCR
ncbi:MAG: putative lipid II flippase FtsW [Proteobacteria bacterium]|nr:putative lipid II flippase FtsW [Pseudomonadota bacterium]